MKRQDLMVIMKNPIDLAIVMRGERLRGRFLLRPARVRNRDRVWVRVERERIVDVTARVREIWRDGAVVVDAALCTGLRFRCTLETAREVPSERANTVCGGLAWDPLAPEWQEEDEPTEKDAAVSGLLASPWTDITVRDATPASLVSLER